MERPSTGSAPRRWLCSRGQTKSKSTCQSALASDIPFEGPMVAAMCRRRIVDWYRIVDCSKCGVSGFFKMIIEVPYRCLQLSLLSCQLT